MNTSLPSLYDPQTPYDFIGPAAHVCRVLLRGIKDATSAGNAPIKYLFNGEPGVGKSALAKFLIRSLGCDLKYSAQKYNGTQVKMEVLEDISRSLAYKDLFGAYRVVWIEEADAIPAVAQVRFLTLMDDLPNGAAVICTSNCKVDDFVKRFQTRFKILEVDAPQPHEIQALLGKFLSDKVAIQHIATFACGNVRQALLDAENALQAAA